MSMGTPPTQPEFSGTGNNRTIDIRGASKWYGDVIGVNQVSLGIGPGVTGLLGPNGAGKSTLIKLITGQLKPGNGSVTVMGMSPWKNPGVFHHLGHCPDSDCFWEEMTGQGFVSMMGRLAGFDAAESERRAREQLERVSMTSHALRAIQGYSKGMRQRVKLAAALVHDPIALVLDEPLNGLDPVGRRDMLELFRHLGDEGKTVLVSSHILHEIESLTPTIVLIHHGRILAEGVIEDIRALIENQPLTLQISTPDPRAVGQSLARLDGVYSLTFPDNGVLIARSANPEIVYETLQADVIAKRYTVHGLCALDDNLDAVFQYLVKE
ncbi:MAG: ABC transporter ATP-binding protein [bacterium]|nr:ABC transporter ATP-binding protein [Candidatus Sumerlaeota bacterium]